MPLSTHGEPEKLPHIIVLGTGGTIAGECASPVTGGSYYVAGKRTISELVEAIPELRTIARVTSEQIVNLPSHAVSLELWLKLTKRVTALLAEEEIAGVVITHGTDTLEETAYFLNVTVKSEKPVVLVGAMRPGNAVSADGPLNLFDAVAVAASRESHGKGVLVVTDGKINGARDVTKTNTLSVETFTSRELGYLGYVVENSPQYYRASTRCHTIVSEFDVSNATSLPQVTILYGYAEQDAAITEAAIRVSSGIIHAGTGNGSMTAQTQALLESAYAEKGIVVVRASRTGNGLITRKPAFAKSPFIMGNNLSPQKARILLMLALAQTNDLKKIQCIFDSY